MTFDSRNPSKNHEVFLVLILCVGLFRYTIKDLLYDVFFILFKIHDMIWYDMIWKNVINYGNRIIWCFTGYIIFSWQRIHLIRYICNVHMFGLCLYTITIFTKSSLKNLSMFNRCSILSGWAYWESCVKRIYIYIWTWRYMEITCDKVQPPTGPSNNYWLNTWILRAGPNGMMWLFSMETTPADTLEQNGDLWISGKMDSSWIWWLCWFLLHFFPSVKVHAKYHR